MKKDKRNTKGKEDSDSSEDENQPLIQRGAHGISQPQSSASPMKPIRIAVSGKATPYETLAETSSSTSQSNPPSEAGRLDVRSQERAAAEQTSPSKKGIIRRIIDAISPKKKSPNKSDSQCHCDNKNNHMPECPEWNKLDTDSEQPSHRESHVHGENVQSCSGLDPSAAHRSDNRLSVPGNSSRSPSPSRRSSLTGLLTRNIKISPGKKMATTFPVSNCDCADKNNHNLDCPEKVQEIEVRLEDAKISKSSTSSSSASPITKKRTSDDSTTSSSVEIRAERMTRITENYFKLGICKRKEGRTPEERQEIIDRAFAFYTEDLKRSFPNGIDLENLSQNEGPEQGNRPTIERMDESCSEDEDMNLISGPSRRRSQSYAANFRIRFQKCSVRNQLKVKYGDKPEAKGATGWSHQSKKLQRQDAMDVDPQPVATPQPPDQSGERRQTAELAAAPGRSDSTFGRIDHQMSSNTDTQLGTTSSTNQSVRRETPSTELGARPKHKSIRSKDASDVGCSSATAAPRSDQSAVLSKTKVCRTYANSQPSSPHRSDLSAIDSATRVSGTCASVQPGTSRRSDQSAKHSATRVSGTYGSSASAQPGTSRRSDQSAKHSARRVSGKYGSSTSVQPGTSRSSNPSVIQNEPVMQPIDGSNANRQQEVAEAGPTEPTYMYTTDEVQRRAQAIAINRSVRRHRSASPNSPRTFGACDCGHPYIHSMGCEREIRARIRRNLRRCRLAVLRKYP